MDDLNDARQWVYADIRKVSQDGIYSLRIDPFVGNPHNLELLGKGMDSGVFRDLTERIARARAIR